MEKVNANPEISDEGRKMKESFKYYMDDFALTEEDLQKPLLDVGTGTGMFVRHVRGALKNTSAYGVELQERKIGSETEGLVVGSGFSLPFPEEQFEIVLAHDYVPMFYDARSEKTASAAVEEMLRVCRKNGLVKFNANTPEQELQNAANLPQEARDGKTDIWFEKRYQGAVQFMEYLKSLEEKGYLVTTQGKNVGTKKESTIFTIQKTS